MKILLCIFCACQISFGNEVIVSSPSESGFVKVRENAFTVCSNSLKDKAISLEVEENAVTNVLWSSNGELLCVASSLNRGTSLYFFRLKDGLVTELPFDETSLGRMVSRKYSREYSLGHFMTIDPRRWSQAEEGVLVEVRGDIVNKKDATQSWYSAKVIIKFGAANCTLSDQVEWLALK